MEHRSAKLRLSERIAELEEERRSSETEKDALRRELQEEREGHVVNLLSPAPPKQASAPSAAGVAATASAKAHWGYSNRENLIILLLSAALLLTQLPPLPWFAPCVCAAGAAPYTGGKFSVDLSGFDLPSEVPGGAMDFDYDPLKRFFDTTST